MQITARFQSEILMYCYTLKPAIVYTIKTHKEKTYTPPFLVKPAKGIDATEKQGDATTTFRKYKPAKGIDATEKQGVAPTTFRK